MNPQNYTRREAVKLGLAGLATVGTGDLFAAEAAPQTNPHTLAVQLSHPLITPADDFQDVSRGDPRPFTLQGQALIDARLTADTWRLEITADKTLIAPVKQPAEIARPLTIADGTALNMNALQELGKKHAARFLKAMQCLNIPTPLGQGLWEGVPLRDVLKLCGKINNVRRIYFFGFHNNDPAQRFQSSLSYTQAMETPPGELPAFIAYRLNGQAIPLKRGGPVRMIIPWAHGFKSIKWLQQIVLTNDYRANDTYALQNNDPESYLKTAAYLDKLPEKYAAGDPVSVGGLAIAGLSGLRQVEYWLRPVNDQSAAINEDDPAWEKGPWQTAEIADPPEDWKTVLPQGVEPKSILGFDSKTGKPTHWPLKYSMVTWSATIKRLAPGKYELRARAVDLNGYPQPEPRPIQKAGKNPVQFRRFEVA